MPNSSNDDMMMVIQALSPLIQEDEILNIYLLGSRVYGYANPDTSDYDYCVVVLNNTKHFPSSEDHLATMLKDKGITSDQKQQQQEEDVTDDNDRALYGWSYHNGQFMYRSNGCDITIYTEDYFNDRLSKFELAFIECVSYSMNQMTQQHDGSNNRQLKRFFTLPPLSSKEDRIQLRKSISAENSHSFVKAKNKLIREHDEQACQKALFHSIRTLIFGLQVAKYGAIIHFDEANSYYYEIVDTVCNINGLTTTTCTDETQQLWYEQYWNTKYKTKYQPVVNKLLSELRRLCPK